MIFDLKALKHVVVLMLENRSFDHVLGALQLENSKVNGILSPEAQLVGPMSACAIHDRKHSFTPDPPHEGPEVAKQIAESTAASYRKVFEDFHANIPPAELKSEDVCRYYTDQELPVTYFLARQYKVCDRWFCSVPTSTMPNRLYSMCGDSAGHIKTPIKDPTIQLTSVFDLLPANDWAIYSGGLSMSLMLGGLEQKKKYLKHQRPIEQFQLDCHSDTLPSLAWIEPRYSWMSHPNDDHPPTPVEAGQELIKYVFEALRFHSKWWYRSALIITYDEHGGFYDHVRPDKIPADARTKTDDDAGFETYGPRVPAIIISPHVEAGSIYPNRVEHASILKFICRWRGLDASLLGRRVSAPSTDDLVAAFNRSAGRIDMRQAPPAPRVPDRFLDTRGIGPSPNRQQSRALANWLKARNQLKKFQVDQPELK